MQTTTEPALIKLVRAAELLGCHPDTLRRCVKDGSIDAIRFRPGGDVFLRRADVAAIVSGVEGAATQERLEAVREPLAGRGGSSGASPAAVPGAAEGTDGSTTKEAP